MATVVESEQRFVLHNASWELYEALLTHIGDRAVRLTYDQGELELMSPSGQHERTKKFLGRLVETLTEELEIPIASLGSTMYRREAKQRGLEPDECYYIQNEPMVRGKRDFDPSNAPPPDLAIEVDIPSSSLDRMAIYAALGVPEVWRFSDEGLSVHCLTVDGVYEESATSRCLPMLPPAEVEHRIALFESTDETTVIRQFRQWVRDHLLQ